MSPYYRDEASFDDDVLTRIFGVRRCALSGEFSIEFHHIEGRGGRRGRRVCSSPFNAFPVSPNIHDYAPVNDPDLKMFFRRFTDRKVMFAVARGAYELTKIDREFLKTYPLL